MPSISDIETIFYSSYKISRHSSRKKIIIKECNNGALIKALDLLDIPEDHFAIKMDKNTNLPICKFFNKDCNLDVNKGVDAILFMNSKKNNIILLCDLKSQNEGDFNKKIKNATAFLKYLDAILVENSKESIKEYIFMSVLCKRRSFAKPCIMRNTKPTITHCPCSRLNKLVITANTFHPKVSMNDLLKAFSNFKQPFRLYKE